jgi:hypothetical protein
MCFHSSQKHLLLNHVFDMLRFFMHQFVLTQIIIHVFHFLYVLKFTC